MVFFRKLGNGFVRLLDCRIHLVAQYIGSAFGGYIYHSCAVWRSTFYEVVFYPDLSSFTAICIVSYSATSRPSSLLRVNFELLGNYV